MIFIPARIHAIFDYILALLLVVSPWAFESVSATDSLIAPIMLVGIGMFVFIFALTTDYELSAVRLIPLSLHITMDVILGLFLLMSPWLFGFENVDHAIHMMAGVSLIAVAAFTVRSPKKPQTDDDTMQFIQWV